MKFAKIAIVAVLFAAPAVALDYDKDKVKAECSAKWGTEYDMVKYCIDERANGFATFTAMAAAIPEDLMPKMQPTIEHCERQWEQEWDMTAYCLDQNIEALASIPALVADIPDDVRNTIVRDCSAKWGAEFDMVAYCTGERVKGWRAINN
ncbi:MAG: hypothetical protein CSA85_00500 [Alphaproteobacteria bacterium]|nr:MAG: hypothetical protein CSA85_00500 [Alphaproteobacteria bacterium]